VIHAGTKNGRPVRNNPSFFDAQVFKAPHMLDTRIILIRYAFLMRIVPTQTALFTPYI